MSMFDNMGLSNRNSGICELENKNKMFNREEGSIMDAMKSQAAKVSDDKYDKMGKELEQAEMSDDAKRVERLFEF